MKEIMPKQKLIFIVLGSTDFEYTVIFTRYEDDRVSAKCDCQAGAFMKLCKHKLSLLSGDPAIIKDQEQLGDFAALKDWLNSTGFPELLISLKSAEDDLKLKQNEVLKIKKAIEEGMKKGL